MTARQFAVHEAEAQRQHVRVKIPARIQILDSSYALRDLSVSGFAAEGITTPFFPRQDITVTLTIAFPGFKFQSELRALVEYYNPKQKTLGAKFSSLTDEQLSLLNTIIKSYMTGVVVTQNDILKIVARDNFLKARKDAGQEKNKGFFALLTRALFSLFFLLAGLAVFLFAAGNVYQKITMVESTQASVTIDTIDIRSTASGLFKSALPADAASVSHGQLLGMIGATTINSPCDCLVTHRAETDGIMIMTGEQLFQLTPQQSAPAVRAVIPSDRTQRLRINGKAQIRIAGESGNFSGTIVDITAQDANAVITVHPDANLPLGLSGRPATVDFFLQ